MIFFFISTPVIVFHLKVTYNSRGCEFTQQAEVALNGLTLIFEENKSALKKKNNKHVLFLDIGAILQTQAPRKDFCTKFQHYSY